MMIDFFQLYLHSLGLKTPLKEVTIQPLPTYLKHLNLPVSGGHSSQTVAETIFNLEVDGCSHLSYVLGYGLYRIPLEQAVIGAGEYYYDPIERLQAGSKLVVVCELSADELTEFAAANNRPPELYDWLQWQSNCVKKSPSMGL
ncbi:hypothetical protein GZ77_04780 [Endozoicomonas montiporae]|uniref:Uncharacterized protein n=2 Tax=Endozoicomonas montiporae TaxID=1027273 RepID=A0A081NBL2_9GAMM|nr:hypothetical protein [Endozoicomonas montiporae]AMO56128.1 hypothetical protein EZMO1_2006 [Endozoicomonas montiporae CL-33]KEQ15835.1 hypothetical protein GZ77_04780 [Endozoicomonas montiporae]